MKKGFTLIELMIVVAIIAIIAAIAIPNLLASRMQANEANAVTSLKAYGSAQAIFKKGNYSQKLDSTDVQEYARPYENLYGDASNTFELIARVFADATTSTTGYQGYFFDDATDKGTNPKWEYGLFAYPCIYESSGVNSFYIDEKGTVFQSDEGEYSATQASTAVDSLWVVP